jgi:hypothetical protein
MPAAALFCGRRPESRSKSQSFPRRTGNGSDSALPDRDTRYIVAEAK